MAPLPSSSGASGASADSRVKSPPCSARGSLLGPPFAVSASSEWELPPEKVSEPRDRDFVRLTELQAAFKQRCRELLRFVNRDFGALSQASPEFANSCGELVGRDLAQSIGAFAPRIEALVRRVEQHEKLRVVFIGPVKAGKSTLINILLTSQLKQRELILPVDNVAATNCIWKVESVDGTAAEVFLDGELMRSWTTGDACFDDSADVRRRIAEFLEDHLDREAIPQGHREVLLRLPLAILNPFGCHYCLVDTPGYTESAEFEELVMRFLQDHSHIACMVCPLTEGLALPQATRNLLQRSYGKTFWVLTRYDDVLLRGRAKIAAKLRKTQRESADLVVEKFTEQIRAVHPMADIFRQAGQVLMPETAAPGWVDLAHQHLKPAEAEHWLQGICAHVKNCFLMIQQEQFVLSSQARQCMDLATELLGEFARLKDGTQGKLAASDHYVRELQVGAEEAARLLEREIRQEIHTVKTSELDRHCRLAASMAKAAGPYVAQATYYDAVLGELVPRMELELHSRIECVMSGAQRRLVGIAQRLVNEAGVQVGSASTSSNRRELLAPGAAPLRGRYPIENVAMLSFVVGCGGAAAASDAGALVLCSIGLRIGTGSLFGMVGVTIAALATVGFAIQAAADLNPFWSYATVERDIVDTIRAMNHWGILAEAASGRACAHLLGCAAQLRCAFSKALLVRGTPREVLLELLPDLGLFERIRESAERTCRDIADFADSPDLSGRAAADLKTASALMARSCYPRVIEATNVYVSPGAHTDAIPGDTLGTLLVMRCRALVDCDRMGEARHTAEEFHKLFPKLLLPLVYERASRVLFEFRAGTLENDSARRDARAVIERLELQWRPPDEGAGFTRLEVPALVELWFLAVMASYLGDDGRDEFFPKLGICLDRLMSSLFLRRPSLESVRERKMQELKTRPPAATPRGNSHESFENLTKLSSARSDADMDASTRVEVLTREATPSLDEAAMLQSVLATYLEECSTLATDVVAGVRALLLAMPASQLDIEDIGAAVVDRILAQVEEFVVAEPALPTEVADKITSGLCPEKEAVGFCEEWQRLLRAAAARRRLPAAAATDDADDAAAFGAAPALGTVASFALHYEIGSCCDGDAGGDVSADRSGVASASGDGDSEFRQGGLRSMLRRKVTRRTGGSGGSSAIFAAACESDAQSTAQSITTESALAPFNRGCTTSFGSQGCRSWRRWTGRGASTRSGRGRRWMRKFMFFCGLRLTNAEAV